MQSFMMGVIMGLPPSKDKELREHQKGQVELRGMSRKLAHVAGTSQCFCFSPVAVANCIPFSANKLFILHPVFGKYACTRYLIGDRYFWARQDSTPLLA